MRTDLEKRLPTRSQAEVLDAIDLFESEHLRPPSLKELAGMLGVTRNAVRGHLVKLKTKGYLTWEPAETRTLRSVGVVVVGEVG